MAWELPSILSGKEGNFNGERGQSNASLTGQQSQKKPEYFCSTFTLPSNAPSLDAYK